MFVEQMLALSVGTRVFGHIGDATMLSGTIAPRDDGSHFIRWSDGCATVPFGIVREYDEFIAAHVELTPRRPGALGVPDQAGDNVQREVAEEFVLERSA